MKYSGAESGESVYGVLKQSYLDEKTLGRLMMISPELPELSSAQLTSAENFLLLPSQTRKSQRDHLNRKEIVNWMINVDKIEQDAGIDERDFAQLYTVAKHVKGILQRKKPLLNTWQNQMYETVMEDREWADDSISPNINPAVSTKNAVLIKDYVSKMEPAKIRDINTMRLASFIWLSQMNDDQRLDKSIAAETTFLTLLSDEVATIQADIDSTHNPSAAFEVKKKGLRQLSCYSFAGLPMSENNAYIMSSLCKHTA